MEAMTLLAKLLKVQQPSNLFLGTKIDIVLDVLLPKITLSSTTQIKNPRVLAAAFQVRTIDIFVSKYIYTNDIHIYRP